MSYLNVFISKMTLGEAFKEAREEASWIKLLSLSLIPRTYTVNAENKLPISWLLHVCPVCTIQNHKNNELIKEYQSMLMSCWVSLSPKNLLSWHCWVGLKAFSFLKILRISLATKEVLVISFRLYSSPDYIQFTLVGLDTYSRGAVDYCRILL